MGYINPLFKNTEITKKDTKGPIKDRSKEQLSQPARAVRKDKTHNIKFPLTSVQQMKLRSYCKQAARIYKNKRIEPLSQTKFNNALLRFGLKNEELIHWDMPYRDSKIYMHSNITEIEYQDIGGPFGLSVRKNLSDRKTVYFIILSVLGWLESGGDLEKIL
ncbi:hypothetical protein FZD47_21150 [Bacillus infantis]|uniref:Uncharacterized protein n=1 Tax=Bacillus infantis TaxID=324767 RepID=A0A5D4SEU9_9BACI|nr:hypothetical protein [Bacillus infantis]TYS60718.1 hypothetical protein FZD47_21150 [Bacillus infantis]